MTPAEEFTAEFARAVMADARLRPFVIAFAIDDAGIDQGDELLDACAVDAIVIIRDSELGVLVAHRTRDDESGDSVSDLIDEMVQTLWPDATHLQGAAA